MRHGAKERLARYSASSIVPALAALAQLYARSEAKADLESARTLCQRLATLDQVREKYWVRTEHVASPDQKQTWRMGLLQAQLDRTHVRDTAAP